jgi:hypothetical protein
MCTLRLTFPITSEFGLLSGHCAACQSADSINALVSAVWLYYPMKITYSTSSDFFLHVLWFAILSILEFFCFFVYGVYLPAKAVNSSVMSSSNPAMPWLLKMPDRNIVMLHWHSFSQYGTVYVMYYWGWNAHNYLVYELLPPSNT